MDIRNSTLFGFILTTLISCGKPGSTPTRDKPNPVIPTVRTETTPVPASPEVNALPLMNQRHKTSFKEIPLEGSVEQSKYLWSGGHWPLNLGLINYRWNSVSPQGFELISPTKDEALLLTEEQLSGLSPSEKYDLLKGLYDYPLKAEVAKKANPVAVYWEGIGNGWASATLNHEEPTAKLLANPDGLMIPFGSSDIKALLSYYYAYTKNPPASAHLGMRCMNRSEQAHLSENCQNDLNAAAFHIALANQIGIQKESFIADIDRFHEVWNHPIVAFRSEVLEDIPPTNSAPKESVKTIKLRTKISYVDQAVSHSWNPIKEGLKQVVSNRIYLYDLHLDRDEKIIGGDWISQDRPDFIWTLPALKAFEGHFDQIEQLLAE